MLLLVCVDLAATQEDDGDNTPVNPHMFMDVAAELDEDDDDAAHGACQN